MNETSMQLQELADRLLADGCTAAVRLEAEGGAWNDDLWSTLMASGLPQAGVPESLGGAGASFAEALGIAESAGRHAVPLPLVETILANTALAWAGRPPVDGPASLPTATETTLLLRPGAQGWTLSGTATRVPWGRRVEQVVLVARTSSEEVALVCVAPRQEEVQAARSVAHEPRDELAFRDTPLPADAVVPIPAALQWQIVQAGALARCWQMVGAMEWSLAQSLTYCRDRGQFGKPVSGFQAVQHLLAQMASEACAARVASNVAARDFENPLWREDSVAQAKSVVGEAAGRLAALAHQVHGAMGYSQEYPLHYRTRRLWTWREEFGSERDWQVRTGLRVAERGSSALWPALTAHPTTEGDRHA